MLVSLREKADLTERQLAENAVLTNGERRLDLVEFFGSVEPVALTSKKELAILLLCT